MLYSLNIFCNAKIKKMKLARNGWDRRHDTCVSCASVMKISCHEQEKE